MHSAGAALGSGEGMPPCIQQPAMSVDVRRLFPKRVVPNVPGMGVHAAPDRGINPHPIFEPALFGEMSRIDVNSKINTTASFAYGTGFQFKQKQQQMLFSLSPVRILTLKILAYEVEYSFVILTNLEKYRTK